MQFQILKKMCFSASISILMATEVMAYGTGQSTYPLRPSKKLISAEMTGITSSGGGVGLQARYTHRLTRALTVDGGLGISGGKYSSRLFLGTDYELFPDYMRQPRISVKANWENVKQYNDRKNIFSLAPTVSKGFSFWGKEAFPYIALPVGLSLDTSNKKYQVSLNGNLGIATKLPFEGYKHIVASLEGAFGIKNAPTAILFGLSLPIN